MRFKNQLWVCFSLLSLTMWTAGCAESTTDTTTDATPPATPGAATPDADTDEAGSTTGGGTDVPAGE